MIAFIVPADNCHFPADDADDRRFDMPQKSTKVTKSWWGENPGELLVLSHG